MYSYKEIVDKLMLAADNLISVNQTAFGSIDKLDATTQDARFPYVFFRPLTSAGVSFGSFSNAGSRELSFEMYVLTLPKQTDVDYLDAMSHTELIGYNVLTEWFDGGSQYDMDVSISSIIPLNEAFQDRAAGWVFNIVVSTSTDGITNCNSV